MVLSNAMLVPVLPQMGDELALSQSAAGLAVTAFSLTAGAGILIAGYLADRIGRKLVVLPGLLLFALGAAGAGLSGWWLGDGGFMPLVGARVVQGMGAAGMAYMAMAFVGDLFQGGSRVTALGILEASAGVGKLLSPIGGALVGEALAWWAIFFVQAAMALLAAAAVWLLTRETHRPTSGAAGQYFSGIAQLFRAKGAPLVACLWTGLVNQLVLFGILFYLTQHLEQAHDLRGLAKGLYLVWPLLALSAVAFGGGIVLDRRKGWLKGAVLSGVGVVLTGVLLLALVEAEWVAFLAVVLAGLGTGLQLPGLNDLITGSADTAQRGGITSIYGAVRFAGTAAGPPVFGWLMGLGDTAPFWASGLLLLITGAAVLFLINPTRLRGDGDQPDPKGRAIAAWQVPGGLPQGTRPTL